MDTVLGERFYLESFKLQHLDHQFLDEYEIANYADDSTPYNTQKNHKEVIKEQSPAILFNWLQNNYMKVNVKSHLLLSGKIKIKANID